MNELRFFDGPAGLTVGEIATLTGARPRAGELPDRRIIGVAGLDRAGPGDLAFLGNARYAGQLPATRAGICLTTERFAGNAPRHVVVLVTADPYRAFIA